MFFLLLNIYIYNYITTHHINDHIHEKNHENINENINDCERYCSRSIIGRKHQLILCNDACWLKGHRAQTPHRSRLWKIRASLTAGDW